MQQLTMMCGGLAGCHCLPEVYDVRFPFFPNTENSHAADTVFVGHVAFVTQGKESVSYKESPG